MPLFKVDFMLKWFLSEQIYIEYVKFCAQLWNRVEIWFAGVKIALIGTTQPEFVAYILYQIVILSDPTTTF